MLCFTVGGIGKSSSHIKAHDGLEGAKGLHHYDAPRIMRLFLNPSKPHYLLDMFGQEVKLNDWVAWGGAPQGNTRNPARHGFRIGQVVSLPGPFTEETIELGMIMAKVGGGVSSDMVPTWTVRVATLNQTEQLHQIHARQERLLKLNMDGVDLNRALLEGANKDIHDGALFTSDRKHPFTHDRLGRPIKVGDRVVWANVSNPHIKGGDGLRHGVVIEKPQITPEEMAQQVRREHEHIMESYARHTEQVRKLIGNAIYANLAENVVTQGRSTMGNNIKVPQWKVARHGERRVMKLIAWQHRLILIEK